MTQEATQGFDTPAEAAKALFMAHWDGRHRLTEKSGSFAGQLVAGMTNLTERQRDWLGKLLSRAELPPLADGGR